MRLNLLAVRWSSWEQESSLAGRQVMVGYGGWLESHGVQFEKRSDDLMAMLRGEPSGRATLARYNVTHIVVDVQHIARDRISLHHINALAYRVASNGRSVR